MKRLRFSSPDSSELKGRKVWLFRVPRWQLAVSLEDRQRSRITEIYDSTPSILALIVSAGRASDIADPWEASTSRATPLLRYECIMGCIRRRTNQASWSDLTFICSNLHLLSCFEDQTVPSSRLRPKACLNDKRALTLREATWRIGSTPFCPQRTIFPIREVLARDIAIVKAMGCKSLLPRDPSRSLRRSAARIPSPHPRGFTIP